MGTKIEPIVWREGEYSWDQISDVINKHSPQQIDIYDTQLDELFEILHPSQISDIEKLGQFKEGRSSPQSRLKGSWVYFEWCNQLLHLLNEEDFFRLRTNRNRDLITIDEQDKLRNCSVAVAGLSVGNSIALSLAYSGIASELILADFDTFSTANMNRVRVAVSDIGKPKIDVTMAQLYQANPFLAVKPLREGVNRSNVEDFFESKNDQLILFDEIDDFEMKIRLRLQAKKHKRPLVMLTSLGDNMLIDIERHDIDEDAQIFHGLIGNLAEEILNKPIDEDAKKRYAVQLVGAQYIPLRAIESLKQIGTTLVGRPQLYGTVAFDGGLAPYVIRQIILGDMPGGRYFLSIPDVFKSKENNKTP